ncbi:unnamed protein product [Vitrella brassicaformis CCMP3155]|uniref:Uncharacterized protein n=1 Tax=Vitrella brassicaformis (strain CCMP3155) TaxID=1169540 RepID=A0A0G4EKG7_VITBC|nr:unnamed protein product [Vitrella brassicaformis CCMP3155]|eukprot:CEL97471.1 unnamed protein product [Vitrella brassicaformis CCMP3155]
MLGGRGVLSLLVLAAVLIRVSRAALPFAGPASREAIRQEVIGSSDFQINIHPPEEDTQDVLDSLDKLLRLEETERRADEEDYVSEKQRLLTTEKQRVRDVVHAAYEPLLATIPKPISTRITRVMSKYVFPQPKRGRLPALRFRQKQTKAARKHQQPDGPVESSVRETTAQMNAPPSLYGNRLTQPQFPPVQPERSEVLMLPNGVIDGKGTISDPAEDKQ